MWQEFSNYLCSKPAKEQELTWNKRVAVFSSERKKEKQRTTNMNGVRIYGTSEELISALYASRN